MEKYIAFLPLVFITSLALGLAQLTAVYSGLYHYFQIQNFLLKLALAPVAFFISQIPLVGFGFGIYGAITAWQWEWWWATLLFCWLPIIGIMYGSTMALFQSIRER